MKTAFNRRTVILAAALGAGTTLLQACGGGDDEPQRNIVELAKNPPELSILVEAVVAADLAATLSTGTLTVFAPTNAAFAALLTELGVSKEALLANKPLLTAVLTYHVLGSTVARPTCHWARQSPRYRVASSRSNPITASRLPMAATA